MIPANEAINCQAELDLRSPKAYHTLPYTRRQTQHIGEAALEPGAFEERLELSATEH